MSREIAVRGSSFFDRISLFRLLNCCSSITVFCCGKFVFIKALADPRLLRAIFSSWLTGTRRSSLVYSNYASVRLSTARAEVLRTTFFPLSHLPASPRPSVSYKLVNKSAKINSISNDSCRVLARFCNYLIIRTCASYLFPTKILSALIVNNVVGKRGIVRYTYVDMQRGLLHLCSFTVFCTAPGSSRLFVHISSSLI